MMRIGHGYDVHRLAPGRRLVLGGIEISYELGLLGHSDADVVIHAVIDSILGALGGGDIGNMFPDNDPKFKDIDSTVLLSRVFQAMVIQGYHVGNIDITIIAQRPKLADFLWEMRMEMGRILAVEPMQINIKATTEEGLGFTGRGEGIACHAVVLLSD